MSEKVIKSKRRKKGSGSISQKENGTFFGRISIAGYAPYSCVGATQKEVEKKLEEFRISTMKNEVIPKQVFVSTYIEDWLFNVKKPSVKPSSFDRLESTYRNHIKKSAVGRSQLGNIRTMDIQKLINDKAETLSYSALKKIYELLNSCFDYAVINHDMNFNPMRAVNMPKKENMTKQEKQMQIFSQDELKKIENTTKITYSSGEPRYRHAYFFVLLANTGLRAGEAIALSWENVDLENRLIYVRQNASCVRDRMNGADRNYKMIITTVKTKNGNRTIPCNDKAIEALLWLKKYQQDHHIQSKYVDCNEQGDLLLPSTLPKILRAILKAADVPYKSVHSFRHTFASNLIRAGVDIKVVSQLMGHASVKITYDTYVHTGIDSAISAVKQLDNIIND